MGKSTGTRALACAVAMIGAGCSAAARDAVEIGEVGKAAPTARPPANAAPYDVHEWGVIRTRRGDVLDVGAVAPPVVELTTADKPILYFHADGPVHLKRVHVKLPTGRLLEAWPPGAESEADVSWTGIDLTPGSGCPFEALPTQADPACARVPSGLPCEIPTLASLRARDAACVRTASHADSFLFYRAEANTFTPPLRFRRQNEGSAAREGSDVEVENDSAWSIPAVMLRIWQDGARTRASVFAPPGPHQRVVVGTTSAILEKSADKSPDAPSDRRGRLAEVGVGVEALRQSLLDLGLTTDEMNAFMSAWSTTLFQSSPMAADELMGPSGPTDSFVYFLPAAAIETIATLDLDPPPRAVKRVFAVWAAAPGVTPSR